MLQIPQAQYWRKIVSRGKYPLLFIYELNQGLLHTHEILGCKTRMRNYCRFYGSSYLYLPEVERFERELIQMLMIHPNKIRVCIQMYNRQIRKLFAWLNQLRKKEITDMNLGTLMRIYRSYEKKMQYIWRWGYLPFLIDDAFERVLFQRLSHIQFKNKSSHTLINFISVSRKYTLLRMQEFELLRLALLAKKIGIDNCRKQIQRHYKKWMWKDSWVYAWNDYAKEELLNNIKRLMRTNPRKIIQQMEIDKRRKLEKRRQILRDLGDKKLNVIADLIRDYNYWHTLKLEQITHAIYLIKPFFTALSSLLGVTLKQFLELTPDEVIRGKINIPTLNRRIKANDMLMLDGKRTILNNKELMAVRRVFEKRIKHVASLKGSVAYPGNAFGQVFLVHSGNIDITKTHMQEGSILVTSMTTTNMASLAKKASAIITDEGGLLCHAAIIARELNIPCVIGTKIATKILKNGDTVEVDADKGIVNIIFQEYGSNRS